MRNVLTLAIPLCFGPCAAQDHWYEAPAWPPTLHYGDCLDLDHLPVGGILEDRRRRLAGTGRTVWPCGGAAR